MKGRCALACLRYRHERMMCNFVLLRMVDATRVADVRQPPDNGQGSADSIRALINVIKKEEITTSVDLGSKIPARPCVPKNATLAALRL